MSYGQCIECGNDLVAHHGVDGLSIRCGHGERIAELEAEVARLTEERGEKAITIAALRDRGDEYRDERDQQREDIRRLMEALGNLFDYVMTEEGGFKAVQVPLANRILGLLAEIKERYA